MEQQYDYNKLSFVEMKEYILKNAPKDKAWFKKIAIGTRKIKDKNGNVTKTIEVYNHLKAKKAFCERYMPDLIPVAKPKREKITKILDEW